VPVGPCHCPLLFLLTLHFHLLCRRLCAYPAPAPPHAYTLSLHDALPILFVDPAPQSLSTGGLGGGGGEIGGHAPQPVSVDVAERSEEHTPELQSRFELVCRLLLAEKNIHGPEVIGGPSSDQSVV